MSLSPETLSLLGRAAELRVSGTSWADAASQLAVARDELRRLVAEHTRDYERLARRARADVLGEARGLAISTLLELMKSPDTHLRMVATSTFVRYDLALKRHGLQEAQNRLERDTSARGQKSMTTDLKNTPTRNTSESTQVQNQQGVATPKNAAQSKVPNASTPAPSGPKPAAPTTPVAPAPAAPVTAKSSAPLDATARRRERLLHGFVQGFTPTAPITRENPLDLEIQRIVDGCLTQ